MYSDYHVHSNFSFDSKEEPEQIILTAIRLGMDQIVFTDHQDFNWPVTGEYPVLNVSEYTHTLLTLKEKYSRQIQVLIGIELGLMKGLVPQYKNLLQSFSFDFVIGSCHIVDGFDPYYSDFWKNKKDHDAFLLYFETLLEALKEFHQIDALGHLDYIVRYSPNRDLHYSVSDYSYMIDEILALIIAHDIKLEINTGSLSQGLSFPNPHEDIIRRYCSLGGKYVTVGSDAHTASRIGYGFEQAEKLIHKYHLRRYEIK